MTPTTPPSVERIAELAAERSLASEPRSGRPRGVLVAGHKTIKEGAIRPGQPKTLEEARELMARWVERYNTVRLHNAIGYITPADRLASRGLAIWATRDARLETAREVRRVRRAELHQAAACSPYPMLRLL